MSDLIRHARAGLTGLRSGDGVISSTRPPGSELLLLDIDFASCRAAILGGAALDLRKAYPVSFLFFSYCIPYKNATAICAVSWQGRSRTPGMSPKENDKMCHYLLDGVCSNPG
jgi:hypothetical protein